MKTFHLLSIIVSIVLVRPAFARLGEDEIQCEERYGFAKKEFVANDKLHPLISGDNANTRTYLYQGWRIRVGFLDGMAVREEYFKMSGAGSSPVMANYEANAILESEKGARTWQPYGPMLTVNAPKFLQDYLRGVLLGPAWIRGDGTAIATKDGAGMHMAFASLAAIQHDEEAKRATEAKRRAAVPEF